MFTALGAKAISYVVDTSQDAQCSNWEQRPLSQDQILYAAADTHCLLALFDTLLSDAFALISPAPTLVEAGDKAGSMIQQRASSLREFREPGLKLFTGTKAG